jgi:alkaline phosphatase D
MGSPGNDAAVPASSPAAPVGRRTVLAGAGAAAAAVALDRRPAHASPVRTDPFGLGVASGDPLPWSVILWTRLVGADGATLGGRDVDVRWEVARDPGFRRVVRRGTARARASLAHSVHVEAFGLEPGRDHWYRFRVGSWVSAAARTRTAPAPWARPASLRLAVANCQDLQNGYWPAYDGIADEGADVVLHLGDYIYEYDAHSAYADRRHSATETPGLDQLRTLSDYRARHAQYKTDPALQ